MNYAFLRRQQMRRRHVAAAIGGGQVSAAALMLASESQGLALDFTDDAFLSSTGIYGSARVKDTGTPANNYDSHPFGLLSATGAATKWLRGSDGALREIDLSEELPFLFDEFGQLQGVVWEPARTNLIDFSDALDNDSYWIYDTGESDTIAVVSSITAAGVPLCLVTENAVTDDHLLYDNNDATSGGTYTCSFFVKKGPGSSAPRYVQLTFRASGHGSSQYANFDIENGEVVKEVGGTARIFAFADGVYRITFTATATATSTGSAGIVFGFINNNPDAARQPSYAGNTNANVYLGRAQYELGSYASSPIPTSGSAVTRAADVPTLDLTALPSSATEGTIYADLITADGAAAQIAWQLDDGTANERISFSRDASNNPLATIIDGGVSQVSIDTGTVGGGTRVQHAFAWKANDCAASMDGAAASTDASATLPAVTTLRLGCDHSGNQWGGILRRLVYVPRRVSDADLPDWRHLQ